MVTKTKLLCPACGADRELIKQMLEEAPVREPEAENRAIARVIIGNCKECQRYFRDGGKTCQ